MRVRRRRAKLSRGPFPVREWFAHRALWVYYAPVLGQAVDVYVPGFGTIAFLVSMLLVVALGRHTEPLCIQCMKDLCRNATPVRQAVMQKRNLLWLQLLHRFTAHRWRPYLWMGLWVCALLAVSWTTPAASKQGWPGVAYIAVTWLPVYLMLRAALVHKRYQYFCPICWRGRGGREDDVPEPDPEPVPTGTKELVPA